jgi:hypothetical protein
MTPLQQKLDQLNLTTMSHHLDQMLAEATAKNLSLAQTLEALIDRELESRYQRSIETSFQALTVADQAFHRQLPL